MSFAGLWESWQPKGPEIPVKAPRIETFTILTPVATTKGARIHNRFRVILQPEDWHQWLDDKVSPEDLNILAAKVQHGRAATEMNQ